MVWFKWIYSASIKGVLRKELSYFYCVAVLNEFCHQCAAHHCDICSTLRLGATERGAAFDLKMCFTNAATITVWILSRYLDKAENCDCLTYWWDSTGYTSMSYFHAPEQAEGYSQSASLFHLLFWRQIASIKHQNGFDPKGQQHVHKLHAVPHIPRIGQKL